MLIFAADLEGVVEVCCGGVDVDEVFVWFWGGIGEVGYGEVFWALVCSQLSMSGLVE